MKRKTAKTIEQRRAEVAALHDRLEEFEQELDDTGRAEEAVAIITATHDGYSARNAMLIAMQCPTATDVSGFKAWLARGRSVKRGEHGIQILAPAGTATRTDDTERADYGSQPDEHDVTTDERRHTRQFFRIAYVFDISQTEDKAVADARRAAAAAERQAAEDLAMAEDIEAMRIS